MSEEQKAFRFKLRAETASVHKKLEERVTAIGLTGQIDDYCKLLSSFLALYRPLEESLQQLEWGDLAIDLSSRVKSPWLEQDLQALRYQTGSICNWPHLPRVSNANEGLGVLYVMEGASLGGQLIGRWLTTELGIGYRNGGRFFSSYGSHIGEMWRTFLEALERAAQQRSNAIAIQQSAISTFQCFDTCLEQMQSDAKRQKILRCRSY